MTGRLPSLKPREVARALREAGFVEYPGKGSHRIYVNEAANRQVVLAWHSREMKRGTLKAIIKQAGFNEDEFKKLL